MSTETVTKPRTPTRREPSVDPRKYELWEECLPLARRVLEDAGLALSWQAADCLAEELTDALLGHFVTQAEANSSVVFGMDGTGPWCSWCGRIPGPRLPQGHEQHGLFCDCRRVNDDDPSTAEASQAEQAGGETP
ncbi:hypothetical protein [Nonomuraea sp. NPDC049400]|uniref:hypothetical protein n=1 Tax=Nonomuraea sp. NPDC049400 TaxID=3364352 RepID=UPI0037B07D01